MKKILFILLAFLAVSCSKEKFAELNEDVKNPTNVPGETLFSNAEKNMSDQIASTNVNRNNFKLWAQYWTETTYTDESNYDIFNRRVPDNAFRTFYRDVLMDMKRSSELISANTPVGEDGLKVQKNKLAIIDIVMVYTYDRLETMFGNIPYTQALDVDNVLPAYDDALTVHKDLMARIDADIAALVDGADSFGSADLIYNGDVAAWKMFANSLKLKMAIEIADVDSESAAVKAAAEAAAPNVFASSDDDAVLDYMGATPNTNPLYVDLTLSGRHDFVPANTIVDIMNGLNDPRRDAYFDLIDGQTEYVGGDYGYSSAYDNYSHIDAYIMQTPTLGNPLLTYSEVQFYLAEANERGFNVGGSAEDHYNEAITSSMAGWGIPQADIDTYLAQPEVAYSTANGTWQEKIGTQAWIAFYTRGYLGWTEWRRLDFPIFNLPPAITSYDEIPVRYTFPNGEQTLNGANYTTAAAAIGGDLLTTKLYWDKH
ncbi:MAG: SusD/RagB family nutrient-binding outer membrane lipoprotein [Bacteroidetes bacterium]|nr:MAG: SusD/RagB family nutrient-binding outer membrane lipoprotein [Bacteroidota bacterium]